MKAFWATLGSVLSMSVIGVVAALLIGMTPATPVNASDTNNFTIPTYDIQYELSRDSEGRSVLKTTELISADFPQTDQNHGLERAIPTEYNKHLTNLTIDSVTDATGQALEYSTTYGTGVRVLRIGNKDAYVHGVTRYVITYTQRDVTRFYQDTNRDEWYWDTNGTQWAVPITALNISITIDPALLASREGEPQCYQGAAGSTHRCTVLREADGRYRAEAQNIRAGQNVTVAFGFKGGTFAVYQKTFIERLQEIWFMVFKITSALGMFILIFLTMRYTRWTNRTDELHTIPAEYIPPKNTSVLTSAKVVTARGSIFGAQLIDLAVRHKLAIIETKPKSFWAPAEYDINMLTDPSELLAEEQELLRDMYGKTPQVGHRLALKTLRTSTAYATRTLDNDKNLKALIEGEYALRARDLAKTKYFKNWTLALCLLGVVTLSPLLLVYGGIVAIFASQLKPLTDKGLDLLRYLRGLDKYIKAAETERLKFLQGPDTAEKVGEKVDVHNPGQIVKLYERVLPYAILFGHEKQWTKRLGDLYSAANTNPDWYAGRSAFSAAAFSSSMASFSQSTSYSSSGSSSSSGGSSGGGFSGGGGGGGGGGGW